MAQVGLSEVNVAAREGYPGSGEQKMFVHDGCVSQVQVSTETSRSHERF